MEDFQYLSANENYAESSLSTPPSRQNGTHSSGITLVLPPLKLGRPVKGGKKVKSKNGSSLQDPEVRKIPRPVKLKPLKEVLTKLITQIKKKDDYAFFISPVDPAQIPGYADVIKRPMDLGTMSAKVSHSRYRSLEEFAADFRLVTSNAKTFNPPGTIYHSEADRIEVWGLDHISKAAGTVIEYETDWNIEIEQDDEAALNVDDDDDGAHTMTPMDVDGSAAASPAPSLMTPVTQTKRGPRGPYKKGAAPTISESIDAEGRLPGSKDGLGAFPPESDWAKMMLSLKLKGKRYRTKKERLRMEKGGPPYCPDGSLDYTEMEDPFSILSSLVPDSPRRPQLTPLYPPLPPEVSSEGSLPPPISAPLKRPFLEISTTTKDTSSVLPNKRRRHWTIMRNAPARGKVKEKDDECFTPAWKVPREPNNTDYGSFGTLVGEVAEETGAKDVSTALGSENKLFSAIRSSVESKISDSENGADASSTGDEYWTDGRAVEAEQYITDIVFGGVDGWAYVRSLAAFMDGSDLSVNMTVYVFLL
ncbi:hypothetical protein SERLA73DRAFT_56919 [Serpula lacrymans var. lacrymans S7.3]|uniref:Bromo domain-containing protein n=1 Tax=Serpula lacrymans var. lacrymans (strain S7.3) TaxID=936435 RepID=F8Q2X4_SERL3|nr:hypothetical protein SERLA73DRAFT_56919 [Serpula lacrymans var. lacrymans S7.3]